VIKGSIDPCNVFQFMSLQLGCQLSALLHNGETFGLPFNLTRVQGI
jgi:hypothetical protein